MTTYTWPNASNCDFNSSSNWTPDGMNPASTAPGPADIAGFTVLATATAGTRLFLINGGSR